MKKHAQFIFQVKENQIAHSSQYKVMIKYIFILILFVFGIVFNLYSQVSLDAFGIPTNHVTQFVDKTGKNKPSNKKKAGNYTIINEIPSPTSSVIDIAFDGNYLWVAGVNDLVFYQISPVDGSVKKTIPTGVSAPYGLTFDGNNLWVADNPNFLIMQVDTANGNVISSFPTPGSAPSYPAGLAWDGNRIWHNDAETPGNGTPGDTTYEINTTGGVVRAFKAVGDLATGLTFDGQYIWSCENTFDSIFKVDTATFSIIESYEAPGGTYPNGLAWDGQYLWVSNNASDSLYQLDIGAPCSSPVSNFTYSDSLLTVSFLDSSSGALNLLWYFGDGDTSSVQNPLYTYSNPGTYNVCLVTYNSCGTDSLCDSVTVICPVPVSSFEHSDSGLTVILSDSSTGATSWLWDFGDGNTSSSQNITYTYSAFGTYTICLTTINSCGSHTSCDSIFLVVTNLGNIEPINDIEVFPNPASTSVIVYINISRLSLQNGWSFTLFDALGSEILKIEDIITEITSINRLKLPAAVYYYNVSNIEGVIKSGKLIIE